MSQLGLSFANVLSMGEESVDRDGDKTDEWKHEGDSCA